jgi:uncharacterized membrane protein YjgN (DUF898 family)
MSAISAPGVGPAPSDDARGHFYGNKREYWRILARDALLLVATLGLYRFWVSTDVRRYLWSRTELAGEQLDYTGDPLELLVGFLVLLVVLGPLLAVLSVVTFASGNLVVTILSAYAPAVLVVPISILALYQARRYRVNHTVFRGLRFHQTGSAWIYALRMSLWLMLNVATFGLSYPWARASLERYKMRHTFYGDVQGSFAGSGWSLFRRGVVPWLIVCGPLFALFCVFSVAVEAASEVEGQKLAGEFLARSGIWLALSAIVIYPLFHAMVLRWRVAGMGFGTLSLRSDFSYWSVYKAYLKYFGLLALLAILVGAGALVVQRAIVPALPLGRSIVIEFIGMVCLAMAYFAVATIAAFAYQGTVRFDTWRAIVDSLALRGLDQVDRAKVHAGHAARHAGRIGAALNLGGF